MISDDLIFCFSCRDRSQLWTPAQDRSALGQLRREMEEAENAFHLARERHRDDVVTRDIFMGRVLSPLLSPLCILLLFLCCVEVLSQRECSHCPARLLCADLMEKKERMAGLAVLYCLQAIVLQMHHLLGKTAETEARVSETVGKCRPDQATLDWVDSNMVPVPKARIQKTPPKPDLAPTSAPASESPSPSMLPVPIAAPIAVQPDSLPEAKSQSSMSSESPNVPSPLPCLSPCSLQLWMRRFSIGGPRFRSRNWRVCSCGPNKVHLDSPHPLLTFPPMLLSPSLCLLCLQEFCLSNLCSSLWRNSRTHSISVTGIQGLSLSSAIISRAVVLTSLFSPLPVDLEGLVRRVQATRAQVSGQPRWICPRSRIIRASCGRVGP